MHSSTDNDGWPTADPDRQETGGEEDRDNPAQPWWRRPVTIAAASVLGALIVLYLIDLAVTAGDVPRGTSVAGIPIGGLAPAAAQEKLWKELTPRSTTPVQVVAGDRSTQFVPASAGIRVDLTATVAQTGTQSANPFSHLASLFTSEDFGVISTGDEQALAGIVAGLRPAVDRPMIEGNVRFDGLTPAPVQPSPGQRLDEAKAKAALLAGWAGGARIELPVEVVDPKASPDGVQRAIDTVARPAVSGPATVRGDGRTATAEPRQIAAALSFHPGADGSLVPALDKAKLDAVVDTLAPTERPGQDARMDFSSGKPVVTPSSNGRVIDWEKTLAALLQAATRPGDRTAQATYVDAPATVTADDVRQLGIKEVIGEFTTGGFAQDSGVNIRMVAAKVNGAIVKPGATFSLNGYTGPRGAAQGYVEAGAIKDGVPAREVGGGISQFATTTYNAAYFAGMTDAGHKEHSFYISRYPAAREATVFQNPDGGSVIDLKFANETATGVAIQTIWTSSSITVKLWGTKHVNVESIPGSKHDYVDPPTITKPAGAACKPVQGKPGFTASDTRVVRDLAGAEISRKTRTVRYNPEPTVICSSSG